MIFNLSGPPYIWLIPGWDYIVFHFSQGATVPPSEWPASCTWFEVWGGWGSWEAYQGPWGTLSYPVPHRLPGLAVVWLGQLPVQVRQNGLQYDQAKVRSCNFNTRWKPSLLPVTHNLFSFPSCMCAVLNFFKPNACDILKRQLKALHVLVKILEKYWTILQALKLRQNTVMVILFSFKNSYSSPDAI